jgi:hypothetical protein
VEEAYPPLAPGMFESQIQLSMQWMSHALAAEIVLAVVLNHSFQARECDNFHVKCQCITCRSSKTDGLGPLQFIDSAFQLIP